MFKREIEARKEKREGQLGHGPNTNTTRNRLLASTKHNKVNYTNSSYQNPRDILHVQLESLPVTVTAPIHPSFCRCSPAFITNRRRDSFSSLAAHVQSTH